ncbi:MAG: hypothetical protein J6C97_03615 [Clostridia bacterium]|nr:hypothetical protein [Clostridia bacterium]
MEKKKKDWGFLVSIIIFCLAFILGVLNMVFFINFNWWGEYYWWILLVVVLMTICYFTIVFFN